MNKVLEKDLVCILCPQGCLLKVVYDELKKELIKIEGNLCLRGKEYALKELFDPERILTTSVLVEGGDLPLVSVKTDKMIPKDLIFQAMDFIKHLRVKAPVKVGQIIVERLCGTEANLIATKEVKRKR